MIFTIIFKRWVIIITTRGLKSECGLWATHYSLFYSCKALWWMCNSSAVVSGVFRRNRAHCDPATPAVMRVAVVGMYSPCSNTEPTVAVKVKWMHKHTALPLKTMCVQYYWNTGPKIHGCSKVMEDTTWCGDSCCDYTSIPILHQKSPTLGINLHTEYKIKSKFSNYSIFYVMTTNIYA